MATVTVTLRTITINSATGNVWLPDCAGLFGYHATQTGSFQGDTFYIDPYQPGATFTSTPRLMFMITLGIGNTGTVKCLLSRRVR